MVALVLIGAGVSTNVPLLSSKAASTLERQDAVQKISLEVGRGIVQYLAPGQKHSYKIEAPAGLYFRLIIQPVDFPLRYTIYSPDSHLCREGRNRPFGSTSISWIALIAGTYLVEVYSAQGSMSGGKYDIRIEEKRAAE